MVSSPPKNGLTYAGAGVDVDRGNRFVKAIAPLVRATARPGADGEIGGFGGLFDLKALDYEDPLLVAANDGVGTKLKLAIETGNHAGVGVDLVAMCANDLVVQGAEPLFFLDYFATGRLETAIAEAVVGGIAEGCRQAGAALIGGETAEMPGFYPDGDYDLAGFCVGAVERTALLPKTESMSTGDIIIGLPSSGPHSNGYSLIRKVVELNGIPLDTAAPFDGATSLGEALLTPTRIYVRPILQVLAKTQGIKALAHITGGGLTDNLPRVLPDTVSARIDLDAIGLPAVFDWLRTVGGIDDAEMLRTFNCGVAMALVVEPSEADRIIAQFEALGEGASVIGALEGPQSEPVAYSGALTP